MIRTILTTALLLVLSNVTHTQNNDFDDTFITENFKLLNTVDTELAICMSPIIEGRMKLKLKDTTSFYSPMKKLSKYVTIKLSEDSLVKTYSWDRINGGSWHDMASYVQFKNSSGQIKYQQLDSGDEYMTGEPTCVIIYDIHAIKSKNKTYYLMLGWGTYGGGLHHCLARVYQITTDGFVQYETIFQGDKYLLAGANRVNKINLKYNSELGELSYFHYEYDEDNGFYNGESKVETWLFDTDKFIKQD
ncbi:hypothetical protein [uncultured Psychroserpens sp.]|uniref:hypothetical protein n=1 Tax=uncultured Psychroserpens sp. TaxID=255436 RepID=UPI00261A3B95|nr:hypothetical protein [uncultured Psychroserpens sp.]